MYKSVSVSDDVHQRIRVTAIARGVSMAEIVRQACAPVIEPGADPAVLQAIVDRAAGLR